jgi:hypothetical protein
MNDYTTQAKIEAYLNRDLTVKEESLLSSIIDYVSNFIRSYTSRDWSGVSDEWLSGETYDIGDLVSLEGIVYECTINHTSSASNKPGDGDDWEDYWELADEVDSRTYDGTGEREIYIDDFVTLSEVSILDSQGEISATYDDEDEWLLYPINKTPKQSIYLRNYRFPSGRGRVLVTAVFGSGAVPEGVVMVCTALCSKFIGRMSSNVTGFKRESIEGYSYELLSGKDIDEESKILMSTLDNYKKVIL